MNDNNEFKNLKGLAGLVDGLIGGLTTTLGFVFVLWIVIGVPFIVIVFFLYAFGILD